MKDAIRRRRPVNRVNFGSDKGMRESNRKGPRPIKGDRWHSELMNSIADVIDDLDSDELRAFVSKEDNELVEEIMKNIINMGEAKTQYSYSELGSYQTIVRDIREAAMEERDLSLASAMRRGGFVQPKRNSHRVGRMK